MEQRKFDVQAVLGYFNVTKAFEHTRLYEYAAAWDSYTVDPQRAPIELVYAHGGYSSSSVYIRVRLTATHIGSWKPQDGLGEREDIQLDWFDTWSLATMVSTGFCRNGEKVAEIEVAEGFVVRQHERDGVPAVYSTNEPMMRIMREDGSPVGSKGGYWHNGQLFREPVL